MNRDFEVYDYRFGMNGDCPNFTIHHYPFEKPIRTKESRLDLLSNEIIDQLIIHKRKFKGKMDSIKHPLKNYYQILQTSIKVENQNSKEISINNGIFSKIKIIPNYFELILDINPQDFDIFFIRQIAFGGDNLFFKLYTCLGGNLN